VCVLSVITVKKIGVKHYIKPPKDIETEAILLTV